MCGILFSKNAQISAFKDGLETMHHRGPDNTGIRTFGEFFLGNKRLSIVDLNNCSNQPFKASDDATYIIFNGEIYNHKELKEQFCLETKTQSDTEVIVELFLKIGENLLGYLNGMFAFIIFNSKTKSIFIARDRLGIKPLYVYEKGDVLIYSSEISAIMQMIEKPKYDLIGIRQYLKLRTFFRGHTLYENITMFPAGYFMSDKKLSKYWSLEDCYSIQCDDETVKSLIISAIEYRKTASAAAGSYLSGGIDSSIIAAIAKKEHSWTIGFKDFNEFPYANAVAKMHSLNHHQTYITHEEYKNIASYMISKRLEPLSVPNEVLLYKMSKDASRSNKVILSGEGADELFYGYDRIFRWANENTFSLESFDKLYSYGSHQDNEIIEYVLEPLRHIKDNLLKISTFFQLYHLHGLLRRLDNSSMLCSIEARVPFVDHRLVEYLYGVPYDYKMRNGIVKEPLKRIFKDILPREIIMRKKVGFAVPIYSIFRESNSKMDAWLHFNMKILLGDEWNAMRQELLAKKVYGH